MMPDAWVRIIAGDPTPPQRAAWQRLWAVLLAPEGHSGRPGPAHRNAPEEATPEASEPGTESAVRTRSIDAQPHYSR
jgi:hypothetical protein